MGNISWEESYVGQMRKLIGHAKLIHPSVRAIIQNERGEILFIDRRGENRWGMPAGSMELDESIYDCLVREVKEETGIDVQAATLLAIYTSPKKSITNYFGDEYQMFELVFHVNKWSGEIITETEETTNAKFYPIDALPAGSDEFWDDHHQEVVKDLQSFTGSVIVK
ncbi:NUDIX domain-containing protein [Bacillus salitolerans]|uniref:NUDIX domain-containing protein n=1 Tax=Bacillus salitolerans TaxID=1437434 RepID=A0ABW4LYF3_9BACI